MPYSKLACRSAIAITLLISTGSYAGPHGYDLHNTLAPRSAGLAGTSIAEPLDNVSAIYGNPAALSQFRGTEFSFGATWYQPEVELTHDGSVTGAAFSSDSETEGFLVPQVGVTQDLRGLGFNGTLGAGLTAVSGIGAQFRHEPSSLGAGAEFIIFGANFGLSYDLNDQLSLGTALTLSFAQMDLGLGGTSAESHDTSWRGSLGLTYQPASATKLGLMYQSTLKHNFKSLLIESDTPALAPFATTTGRFTNVVIEQPQNLGIGLSNRSFMDGRLLLAVDILYKAWESTEFWGDVYENQWVYSIGAELTSGAWRFRTGYGFAEDPTKENPTSLGGIGAACAGAPSSCLNVPLVTPVIEYLQAAEAAVIYEHRLSFGVGYKGFLAPMLDIDSHFSWQFEEERDYGVHTQAKTHSWHAGFALTWHFE